MQSVFEQDLERLVKQYDQPGPCYTSYPTVPVWPQGSFGRDYAEALEAEGPRIGGFQSIFTFRSAERFAPFAGATKSSPVMQNWLSAT